MPAEKLKKILDLRKKGWNDKSWVAAYRNNPGSMVKNSGHWQRNQDLKLLNDENHSAQKCAGQMKKFPKAAKDPNSRLRQAAEDEIKKQKLKNLKANAKIPTGGPYKGMKRFNESYEDSKLH